MLRKVPLPIDPIICGQYIEIAMPVKNDAMPGEMPLSATVVATEANVLAGLDQHGAHPLAQLCGEVGVVIGQGDTGPVQRGQEGVVVVVGGGRRGEREARCDAGGDGQGAGSM